VLLAQGSLFGFFFWKSKIFLKQNSGPTVYVRASIRPGTEPETSSEFKAPERQASTSFDPNE